VIVSLEKRGLSVPALAGNPNAVCLLVGQAQVLEGKGPLSTRHRAAQAASWHAVFCRYGKLPAML